MISSSTFVCEIPREFNAVLQNTLRGLDFTPTLAFGFVTPGFQFPQIMDSFKTHKIKLFGTTCAGMISFDKAEDIMSDKGAVFILTDIPEEDFRLQLLKRADATTNAFGKNAGEIIKKSFKSPSVLTAFSGLGTDIQAIIDGMGDKKKDHLKMFGCLAGDDLKLEKPLVFTESDITDNGVLLLMLNEEKITLSGMTTSGWNGLGTDFTITKAKANEVLKIDDQPALDFYINYLNISEEDLPLMGLEYPLMIKDQDETSIFKSILKINKEKRSLIFGSSIKEGTIFSFAASPGFEILEKTRERVIEFHEKNPHADLILLCSAVARKLAIGPLINTEIKLAAIKWKVPLAGCFDYGEIANDNDNPSKFYNQSFTLALLTEKPVHSL